MSQMVSGPAPVRRGKASSNVYTALAFIATVALIIGIGFVWVKSGQVFETSHPFQVVEKNQLR